jgi:hypothetical protein
LAQHLFTFQVPRSVVARHKHDDLLRGLEVQLSWQWSVEILLQKLAMSAAAALERDVHPVLSIPVGHGNSIGEVWAKASAQVSYLPAQNSRQAGTI